MFNIICVDDQQEVLDSIIRDLRPLTNKIRLEEASDEADCLSLLDQLHEDGEKVAIILSDRVMPYGSGIELLATIAADPRFANTRRVVLTALPQDDESLQAMEKGIIHAYLEKPWQQQELIRTLEEQLHLYNA